jgi:uncharacterized protein YebE (UPF0316 family)
MVDILPDHPILTPALIFLARVTDVSMGTVRLICVTRGQRLVAIVLGFFELLIWVFAVSSVFAHLDQWINIVAFAGGFAAGNALGMSIEARLALGVQTLSFISRGRANAVAERLRYAGLPVTTLLGSGRDGPVVLCMAVVPRRQTPTTIKMAKEIDPDVVVTVEDVRQTTAVHSGTYGPGKIPMILAERLWPWSRGKGERPPERD